MDRHDGDTCCDYQTFELKFTVELAYRVSWDCDGSAALKGSDTRDYYRKL
jgi:hypothetical protein